MKFGSAGDNGVLAALVGRIEVPEDAQIRARMRMQQAIESGSSNSEVGQRELPRSSRRARSPAGRVLLVLGLAASVAGVGFGISAGLSTSGSTGTTNSGQPNSTSNSSHHDALALTKARVRADYAEPGDMYNRRVLRSEVLLTKFYRLNAALGRRTCGSVTNCGNPPPSTPMYVVIVSGTIDPPGSRAPLMWAAYSVNAVTGKLYSVTGSSKQPWPRKTLLAQLASKTGPPDHTS